MAAADGSVNKFFGKVGGAKKHIIYLISALEERK